MSEPTASPKTGAEKKEGASKYMRRMKTILRGTRSNRGSVSSIAEIMGESSKSAGAAKASTTSSTATPAVSKSIPKRTEIAAVATPTATTTTVHKWSTMQEERARALFAKYGLTLEPGEWITGPAIDREVQRVEKPIRMRVRRHCHRCLTTFGADKICVKCQHIRCKKCFRYPPSKTTDQKGKECAARDLKPAAPKKGKVVLTIPSKTGGQDLIRKPIRQRVRRTCHICSTLFNGHATECENCRHIRCKKCPRDPAKLNKYPDGYPGDVDPPYELPERVWKKPRRRVRWTCHSCSAQFLNGDKTCGSCNHDRCKDCIRDPPKKIKPEPDPEVLRRVEEKLSQLDVS
ncbi:hypothetical protein FQN57_007515 [Myotisia sp. PD_48]|nr:hypothetical protein FQN57_007515 [Myotisia sp. PD_48]